MESGRFRAFSQLRRFVAVVEPDPKAKLMGFPRTTAAGPVPLGVQHFFLSKGTIKKHRHEHGFSQQLPDFQTSSNSTAAHHVMLVSFPSNNFFLLLFGEARGSTLANFCRRIRFDRNLCLNSLGSQSSFKKRVFPQNAGSQRSPTSNG